MLAQRGVVMFVALIVLIIMSLAGIAMLRQIGGGLSIAGNIAFKQAATTLADVGTEQAVTLITAKTNAIQSDVDDTANGYWSSAPNDVDPTDAYWASNYWNTAATVTGLPTSVGSGTRVQFVVHRLCDLAGKSPTEPGQRCSAFAVGGGSMTTGGPPPIPGVVQAYYRVTTKVTGPRNTVSYTQVVFKV